MGCDYVDVRCEVPLPDGVTYDEVWLQTSDLVNSRFGSCTITKTGRLESSGVDQYFHGWINLYGDKPGSLGWRKYMAKFTDGQLVEIISAKAYSHRSDVMPRYFTEYELNTDLADNRS